MGPILHLNIFDIYVFITLQSLRTEMCIPVCVVFLIIPFRQLWNLFPMISNHFRRIINSCILFSNPFSLLNNWFPMIYVNRPHSVISLVIRSLKSTFRSFTLLICFHALLIRSPFYSFIPVDFIFIMTQFYILDSSVNVSQFYTNLSLNDSSVTLCLFWGYGD